MSQSGQRSERWTWALSVLLLAGLLLYLTLSRPPRMTSVPALNDSLAAVRVVGSRQLQISRESPLRGKLAVVAARVERTAQPMLSVTGSVVASLPAPDRDQPKVKALAESRWQFASSELLSAFVEWEKSGSEVELARKQLATAQALSQAKLNAQTRVVERLHKLVEAGSDAPKDLALEQANLLQARLEGQKSVQEATTALRQAERARAALFRQLEQAGLDPDLLSQIPSGSAVLVADVPESTIAGVRIGQGSRARFYGLPEQPFDGRVNRISPTVTRENRTLRVLVVLRDEAGRLRPGMFADVGIGTDERDAIFCPTDGVLHVGRADLLLVASDKLEERWSVTAVQVGELRSGEIEVLAGVRAGDRVIGTGAILLKALVVDALARH